MEEWCRFLVEGHQGMASTAEVSEELLDSEEGVKKKRLQWEQLSYKKIFGALCSSAIQIGTGYKE